MDNIWQKRWVLIWPFPSGGSDPKHCQCASQSTFVFDRCGRLIEEQDAKKNNFRRSTADKGTCKLSAWFSNPGRGAFVGRQETSNLSSSLLLRLYQSHYAPTSDPVGGKRRSGRGSAFSSSSLDHFGEKNMKVDWAPFLPAHPILWNLKKLMSGNTTGDGRLRVIGFRSRFRGHPFTVSLM